MQIQTSDDLKEAIRLVLAGDKSLIFDIFKYKWYNYYQNIHVKVGSETDIANEKTFEDLKINHPKIHKAIEGMIDHEIEKLNSDV